MSRTTPLLDQYRRAKAEHPDAILFFRIGDFYEMFEEDAVVAARECDLTLTAKPVGKNIRVRLAGVPWHQWETYAARLTKRGYRVAICDQLEDPKKAKGIVKRGVTRVLSPGTFVTEAEAGENRYLGLVTGGDGIAVALADLSTGECEVGRFGSVEDALEALVLANPPEVLYPEGSPAEIETLLARLRERAKTPRIAAIPAWTAEPSWGVEVLAKHLGGRLEGYGLDPAAPETAALGALVAHLRETQGAPLPHLATIRRLDRPEEFFLLDETTARHLEVVAPLSGEGPTLLSSLDATKTAMGRRALRRALLRPFVAPRAIEARRDAVRALVEDPARRARVREALGGMPDLERLLGKVALGTAGPRDLVRLAEGLEAAARLSEALSGVSDPYLAALRERCDPVSELVAELRAALRDDAPLRETEGDFVREGYDEELDAIRAGAAGAREYIARLEAEERARTGIGSLRVRYNRVFGWYIEVTKANLDKVPPEYERKQTLANAERFTTKALREAEAKVLGAAERATEREREIFRDLVARVLRESDRIRGTAEAAAEIDLRAALAETAAARGWCAPELAESGIEIRGGRHPVLEDRVPRFVPNDFVATRDRRFFLVTGPNMGGKSTYLRQNALVVLLAQIGSFVPARSARIAPVDAIYSRVGASDRIAEGLSTFMVEMVETAAILRRATPRSLVLLDEIGRGTATYDGLSIAWAVSEHLIGLGPTVLFATHYHELVTLAKVYPEIANLSVAVREWEGEVVFLYEIVEGPADRSYGIEVARRAGFPPAVVARAAEILARLEMQSVRRDGRPRVADAADGPVQLDLFGIAAGS